jgi:thioesterase domain-containing protein
MEVLRKFHTILRGETKSLAIVKKNTRLVALQSDGERTPFFIVGSYPYFIDVVKLTGTGRPVLSLIFQEEQQLSEPYSVSLEAAAHVKTILDRQAKGPHMLGGFSAKGTVAYEIAQQLQALGHEVGLLVLFDTPNWCRMPEYSGVRAFLSATRAAVERLRLGEIPGRDRVGEFIGRRSIELKRAIRGTDSGAPTAVQFELSPARIAAAREYRPEPYSGRLLLFKCHRALGWRWRELEADYGWGETVRDGLEVCQVGATNHLEICKSEADRALVAQTLRRCFDEVEARSPSQLSLRRASERPA